MLGLGIARATEARIPGNVPNLKSEGEAGSIPKMHKMSLRKKMARLTLSSYTAVT